MINKELLSEVLNINVQTEIHEDDLCSNNILIYWEFDGYSNDCKNINIYELAHNKCKEWAWSLGYDLPVTRHKIDSFCCKVDERNVCYHKAQWAESEPEAIFKAAQWILDNTSTNKLKGH